MHFNIKSQVSFLSNTERSEKASKTNWTGPISIWRTRKMSCFISPFQTGHKKRPDNVCYTFESESKHADSVQMTFTGVLLLEALVTRALSLVVKLYMYTRRTVYSRSYPDTTLRHLPGFSVMFLVVRNQPNVHWHNFAHLQDA